MDLNNFLDIGALISAVFAFVFYVAKNGWPVWTKKPKKEFYTISDNKRDLYIPIGARPLGGIEGKDYGSSSELILHKGQGRFYKIVSNTFGNRFYYVWVNRLLFPLLFIGAASLIMWIWSFGDGPIQSLSSYIIAALYLVVGAKFHQERINLESDVRRLADEVEQYRRIDEIARGEDEEENSLNKHSPMKENHQESEKDLSDFIKILESEEAGEKREIGNLISEIRSFIETGDRENPIETIKEMIRNVRPASFSEEELTNVAKEIYKTYTEDVGYCSREYIRIP